MINFQKNTVKTIKVVVLGDETGNTSIIECIASDTFSEDTLSTINSYFIEKKMFTIKWPVFARAGK